MEIYINGVLAAKAGEFTVAYEEMPIRPDARAALKPGKNLLAVHCKQTMGGQYMLRGYRNYRFRDTRQMYLSGEYRWEANASTDLAIFYEWGKVFDEHGEFGFDDGETSYGIGIRFKNYRRVVFRIDVGHSDAEGTFTHISAGPSF